MPVILGLRRLREEESEFQASLVGKTPHLKTQTKQKPGSKTANTIRFKVKDHAPITGQEVCPLTGRGVANRGV